MTTALGKNLKAEAVSAAGRQGVVWTLEGRGDLNANLVRFGPGRGVGEHVNDEVDVVFVGVSGSGFVEIESQRHALGAGTLVCIPKGLRRSTRSLSEDFAYLTVHRRRETMHVVPLAPPRQRHRRTRDHGKEVDRMKRHPSLRKFSDDHHEGLVQARHLRRAAAGEGESPQEAARAFLRFWAEDTSPHFKEEEEVLLAVFARHGGDLDAEPIREMVADHARIRGLVMTLSEEDRSGEVSPDTLRGIGERLEAHIRLEERRVFPLVEATLPEEGLEEVGARFATG